MSPLGNRAHGCGKPWGGTGRVGSGELIQAGLVGSGLGAHALRLYGANVEAKAMLLRPWQLGFSKSSKNFCAPDMFMKIRLVAH